MKAFDGIGKAMAKGLTTMGKSIRQSTRHNASGRSTGQPGVDAGRLIDTVIDTKH
jgi:hypothetical protein